MKIRSITLLLSFLISFQLIGQQFSRDKVILELATTFEDPMAKGAILGANELKDMGDDVAIIVYHLEDSLQDNNTLARAEYYDFSTTVNNIFDGIFFNYESNPLESQYYSFHNKILERNVVQSDFEISLMANYEDSSVEVQIEKNPESDYSNLRLMLAITKSNIDIDWLGIDKANFIIQTFIPNTEGTEIIFVDNLFNYSDNFDLSISPEEAENYEVIAFIQDSETREIYQGSSIPLVYPDIQLDAAIKKIVSPVGSFCNGGLPVEIIVKNNGTETIENLHFEYNINNQYFASSDWEGSIAFDRNVSIELPNIEADLQAQNYLTISCSNPNGGLDQEATNNTKIQLFLNTSPLDYTAVFLDLKTDSYPDETSWVIKNSIGDTVYSGGSYDIGNWLYKDTLYFDTQDCYSFEIQDTYGDGICCGDGDGYFKLAGLRDNFINVGGEFHFSDYRSLDLNTANSLIAFFDVDSVYYQQNDTVYFNNLSFGDYESLLWEFESGDPTTSIEENPSVIYKNEGKFNVGLTIEKDGLSNTYQLTDYIVVGDPNGVVENFSKKIVVSPNPFTTFAKVSFETNQSSDYTIKLINIDGKVVRTMEYKSMSGKNNLTINTNGLNKGVYLLVIDSKEEIYKRLVLKI